MASRTPGTAPPSRPPKGEGDPTLAPILAQALLDGTRPEDADEDSTTDRWTHRFHTWPASLHPDAVARVMDVLPPGTVGDPFCGGGTTLVEGLARGRRVVGRDLSPIAVRVSRLRTTLATPELLGQLRKLSRAAAAEAQEATQSPPPERLRQLEEWYEPHVLIELESIRHACMKAPEAVRPLLLGCFSSILVKTSLRSSDTLPRKVTRKRPPGTTAILFHKKARELGRRLEAFRQAVPEGTPAADIEQGDALAFSSPYPLASIVTSPPYPGVYDYVPMQQLREVWLGIRTDDERRKEIGSRRAFAADRDRARSYWLDDMVRWFRACHRALQPGAPLVVFVGDGRVGHKVVVVREPLEEAARGAGFRLRARAFLGRDDPWGVARFEHAFWFEAETRPPERP